MQLDRIRLNLRRRTPWEAIDLGLTMLRAWARPVYRVWFATFIPFAVLTLALLWQWPTLGMLIVWWLKPVFDRILLKVFAEATFDAPPSLRDVWRAMPNLLRRTGLLSGLSIRRFNPHRSFDLPIWQLEGQRGKALTNRRRVLSRKTAGYAFWLIFVCSHLIVIYEFGFLGLIEFLTPSDALAEFSWYEHFFGETELWQSHVLNIAWMLAETIVEPFYVAAGFSLYLNRRSELEGWDIEVAFRHMAEQHAPPLKSTRQPTTKPSSAVSLVLVLAVASGIFCATAYAPDTLAQEVAVPAATTEQTIEDSAPLEPAPLPPPTPRAPSGDIKKAAQQVLADPVFGQEVEEQAWRPRKKNKEKTKNAVPAWAESLIKFAELMAKGLRGLLYVLIALAIAALLVVLYRQRHRFMIKPGAPVRAPDMLFGLDLRPDSLPNDIAAAALAEVDAGRLAAALSLLYRGALVALIEQHRIEFRDGDTENNCLHRVKGRIDAEATQYFAELLEAWKRTAYAETPPTAPIARDFCQRWPRHFSAAEVSA